MPGPVFVVDRGPNYSPNPARHVQKQVVRYSSVLTVAISMFPRDGTETPFPGRVGRSHLTIGAQMPSTPSEPADVIPFSASGDSVLSRPSPRADSETTAPAAEEVSPQPTLITEHEVMLGTAAALAPAPSFEGQDEAEGAMGRETRGWFATLARLATRSPHQRPPRQHYPPRLDFREDARMAREMYRL